MIEIMNNINSSLYLRIAVLMGLEKFCVIEELDNGKKVMVQRLSANATHMLDGWSTRPVIDFQNIPASECQ